ncbi:MAG: TatD family hydrolase [Syntrophomonadaceae bacterium]|jgi:TatD DNase family protein
MLIDSHAHIQKNELTDKLEDVLGRAKDAGVEKIICVGYDYPSSVEAVKLASEYPMIYAVVGVHPHDAKTYQGDIPQQLLKLAKSPKVVAIGEIGLDFYRDLSPRDQQRKVFFEQIKLAQELYKPIVIHDRDAHQEVMEIIKKEKAGKNEGVMHCYSGYLPMAVELIKEGFYISFAGPLTYKNAKKTQEVAAKIPIDRILVETDCPYLTPEPYRGSVNEPARVRLVAEKLSAIRHKTVEEIIYLTGVNARKVFRIN